MSRILLVLVAVAGPAFAAGSFFTPHSVISSRSVSLSDFSSDLAADDDVDAYGNEVSSAVAEYALDGDGDLYERHSPRTELPHLGSPES